MEIGTYPIKSLTRTLQKCQSHSVDCRPFLRFWSVNSPGISPDLESERSLQPPQDSFGIVRFFPSPSEPRIVPRIARLAQNPHQTGNGFRKIGGLSDRPPQERVPQTQVNLIFRRPIRPFKPRESPRIGFHRSMKQVIHAMKPAQYPIPA